MKKIMLSAAAIAITLSSSLSAGEFGIEVGLQGLELDGQIEFEGTSINIKNDLGLTKTEKIVVPTISYTMESSKVYVSYEGVKFDGSSTLSQNITFNGKTYTATSNVASKLETDWYVLGYQKTLISDYDGFSFNLGAELNIIDSEVEIVGGGVLASYDEVLPIPTITLGLDYKIDRIFSLNANLAGLPLGSYGHYMDYSIGAKVDSPNIDGLTLNLSYKNKEFDLEDDADSLKLDWRGVYFGIGYKF